MKYYTIISAIIGCEFPLLSFQPDDLDNLENMDMNSPVLALRPIFRDPYSGSVVMALGFLIAGFCAELLLPHLFPAYAIEQVTLFSLEGWLQNYTWTAAFAFLTGFWLTALQLTGHSAYRAGALVRIWLVFYGFRAVAIAILAFSGATIMLSQKQFHAGVDILTLMFFLPFLIVSLRYNLRQAANTVRQVRKPLHVAALSLVLTVQMGAFYAEAVPCHSLSCRSHAVKTALGEEVYAHVEHYIIHAPAIAEDIGNVTYILPQPGSRSRIYSWLDYAADLFLEIRGSRGTGILNLKLSGNNYKELEDATAIWEFAGKPLPLGGDGGPDVDRIRLDALHTHEQLVQAAFSDQDCPRTLRLINENAMLSREHKSYDLDHKQAALIQATCAEAEGDTRKAAVAYAQYSFFITPPAFREKPEDMATLREAERYLDKALHLYPDYPHRRSWELRKEALRIQQLRTERPDDQALCLKLKETLAANRVHYVNACR